MLLPSTQSIAALALERMLYCLAEGSAVAAAVAVVLRLAPERNSRTRFAVWLAALTAVVVLPVVQLAAGGAARMTWNAQVSGSSRALVTLSGALAEYIVLAWAAIAGLGLLRVAAGLFQIDRLRRGCVPVGPGVLGPELETVIREFSRRRPAAILVSPGIEVPTAIGFFRPAVLIPAWMIETAGRDELKYILLHELAHLQRWDDWTNLAQKVAKAVLFFHPGVWWIERKLSLDREMACDEAVLVHAGSPRLYARCLARVAEKSFLRRQIVLAQAAVDRMRQLSLRVTRILSADRQLSTRLWRPAMPMVAAIALLCAISTANVPGLVMVQETRPVAERASLGPVHTVADPVVHQPARFPSSPAPQSSMVHLATFKTSNTAGAKQPQARSRNAQPKRNPLVAAGIIASSRPGFLKPDSLKPDSLRLNSLKSGSLKSGSLKSGSLESGSLESGSLNPGSRSRESALPDDVQPLNATDDAGRDTRASVQGGPGVAQQYGVVFVVMTGERMSAGGFVTWQVKMWELRLPAPAEQPTKPNPSKT